ncbi:SH22A protein, partial [Urocolius indicus]|nr:SH22A protein [Urocolius indicus]
MDDEQLLFSTFKPMAEDNTVGAKPGPSRTLVQPPGHHDTGSRVSPCSWLSPAAQSPLEGQPGPELEALQAQTRLWFEQTQAQRLRAQGELPSWFHGFISRRQTEQLLQHRPLGCFLVRFSQSTVAFVLSYR